MEFTVGILGADVFNGRVFGLFRGLAVLGRVEAKLIDLCVKIVEGGPEVQGVTRTHGNEQDAGKDQRVGRLCRNVIAGENSLFLNPYPVWMNNQIELNLA